MKYITMQIGYQFKVVKYQMENVLRIIMDHQQDNVFKMEQMDIGIQILQTLAMVRIIHVSYLFTTHFFFSINSNYMFK